MARDTPLRPVFYVFVLRDLYVQIMIRVNIRNEKKKPIKLRFFSRLVENGKKKNIT